MGKNIWESLSSTFKIDILGSKVDFMRGQEYDGPLLWGFIRRRINPTTTVGASKLKDMMEAKKVLVFGNDIVRYNTRFEDTRDMTIKEEGEGYNEYLRPMFRGYLSCSDSEFVDAIKDERKQLTQGKLGSNYSYRDLMDLGRLTYNKLLDEGTWDNKSVPPAKKKEEKNYLPLATELMIQFSKINKNPEDGARTPKEGDGIRSYLPWRYENKDNLATKETRGITMRWCKNDCHDKPCVAGGRTATTGLTSLHQGRKRRTTKEMIAVAAGNLDLILH